MTLFKHHFPTFAVFLIGLAGVLAVLFAWQLPPFAGTEVRTDNAYVRGRVITLSPQISGYVTEVPVQDFQQVRQGDILVKLDDRTARQSLAKAQAALTAAKAALASNAQSIRSAEAVVQSRKAALDAAEAALDKAQANAERQKKLEEKGHASTSDVEDSTLSLRQAETALITAQSNVAVAQEDLETLRINIELLTAQLASAKASVELAQINLEHTVVRALHKGRLGQIGVQPGQFVTAGTSLMSYVEPEVWVIANINERELADMEVGQQVSFTVDALRDKPFTGRVTQFSPATASEYSVLGNSTATGNFTKIAQRLPVKIEIDPDQPDRDRLAPGMSVVLHALRVGQNASG
ncbi:HlyD family secretion protein [Aquicoccus sp. SU-CL01552]|uniref:HlyD family secretion protein n=1 Tax=Aquicoccus sp. SU-CL01552 TaxID=3127656 RepID=UPI003109028E